jgi:hypothetical protein
LGKHERCSKTGAVECLLLYFKCTKMSETSHQMVINYNVM